MQPNITAMWDALEDAAAICSWARSTSGRRYCVAAPLKLDPHRGNDRYRRVLLTVLAVKNEFGAYTGQP